jgi:hypothetical protein
MFFLNDIFIDDAGKKGRGVFTKRPIPAETLIETAPVIVLSPEDRTKIEDTGLYYYIFEWGENTDYGAVGLGYISIYNHESPSNCEYLMDYAQKTISIQVFRQPIPYQHYTEHQSFYPYLVWQGFAQELVLQLLSAKSKIP